MVAVETIAIKLTVVLAKAILERFVPNDLSKDLLQTLAEQAVDQGASGVRSRTDTRRLSQLGAQLVERMESHLAAEFRAVDDQARAVVALEVASTLSSAQIDAATLVAHKLDPDRLAARLRQRRIVGLADAEVRLYDLLLRAASRELLNLADQFTGYPRFVYSELLQSEEQILEHLQRLLSTPNEIARSYEDRYRRAITHEFDQFEPFGIRRFVAEYEPQKLTHSFVTPSLTYTNHNDPEDDEESAHDLVAAGLGGISYKPLAVTDALRLGKRLVLRGDAGSGKTTLLRWIAVQTATGALFTGLDALTEAVPFLVRLRDYANPDGTLHPDLFNLAALLARSAEGIIGRWPGNWPYDLLDQGRALLLVDGIDELPQTQRATMLTKLEALLHAYPLARYILTSRPPAIDSDRWPAWANWTTDHEFVTLDILPLDPRQVADLIDRWHAAVAHLSRHDPPTMVEIATLPASLKGRLRAAPALRLLATNPLLCAMICAIHRERREQLIGERVILYRDCVELLLEDKGRAIPAARDYPRLSWEQKHTLASRLAYRMHAEGTTVIAETDADDFFASQLSILGLDSKTGPNIRDYFVERSGLLRRPAADQLDFAHRSFQEYLAARAIVDQGTIAPLIDNALDDQWREVIILAAGQARPNERGRLLNALIDEERYSESETRQHAALLALTCLAVSNVVEPYTIGARVVAKAQACFPPDNFDTAELIGQIGDLAVPYLAAAPGQDVAIAAACVRALARTGSPAALNMLEGYANDDRYEVAEELGRGWSGFDRSEYLTRVLARQRRIVLPEFPQDFDSHLLAGFSNLIICDPEFTDLTLLQGLTGLTSLTLDECAATDLTPLPGLTGLTSLTLDKCAATDLTPLPGLTSLTSLTLYDVSAESLAVLQELPGLTSLALHEISAEGIALLQGLTGLTSLTLDECDTTDLTPLQGLTGLTSLAFWQFHTEYDVVLTPLHDLPSLTSLTLGRIGPQGLKSLQDLPSLTSLEIWNTHSSDVDFSLLRGLSNLTSLTLSGLPLVELTFLMHLTGLSSLSLRSSQKIELTPIRNLIDLTTLRLDVTRVFSGERVSGMDLTPLLDLPMLTSLTINGKLVQDLQAFLRQLASDQPPR